jgi:hypothetical protein
LCTAHEFPLYVWHEPKPGRAEKETPLDANDHGCDATRYAVMHVDGGCDRPLPTVRIPNRFRDPLLTGDGDRRWVARLYGDDDHSLVRRSYQ